ncbi:hypothetical protein N7530_001327 [Penicillium desertorum]|uniref:Folliculin/SMCR8 longin domain-containing protein n=1 Tax=Penicillium desertorum TaxID=1303715 RepID=A0A9W9XA07_9EURO|nr:hypothetical protein N7530_001327 [Penicillium desertorum]
MDFILSLTHFCEVHGPTSIICSQVLPFSCPQCHPESDDSPQGTPASHESRIDQSQSQKSAESKSPRIEDHPYFLKGHPTSPEDKSNRGGANGDTCASCSLSLPENVSKQLPPGAPGSRDAKGNSTSPVLRSRELVYSCGNNHTELDDETDYHTHASPPDSLRSASVASDSSCHTHIHTYLSQRGPPNPADYALLRRSSIRTLSYPMARGKRRSYALVALAGRDAGRAFRACPIIWRAFGRIATSIVHAAERFQEDEKTRDEQNNPGRQPGRQYPPVSSFLTGRGMDPAGRRAAGQIRARNLAEIVGNEYIFTELHAHFVALLQQLGAVFGGIPLNEERFVCSTVGDEEGSSPSQPVLVSKARQPEGDQKYDGDDIDISNLEISAGPKAIPITPRRPVMA